MRPLLATEVTRLRRQPDLERSGEKSGAEKEFEFWEPSAYGWGEVTKIKLTTENR